MTRDQYVIAKGLFLAAIAIHGAENREFEDHLNLQTQTGNFGLQSLRLRKLQRVAFSADEVFLDFVKRYCSINEFFDLYEMDL